MSNVKFQTITRLIEAQNIRLFLRYVVFAGFATLVDLGILFALTEWAGLWYFYSAAISYIVGMLTNYTLNKYLNFKNKSKKIIQQFGLFALVALVGLGFNQLILYFLVEAVGLWYMLAKCLAVLAVMFWSFYGHKKLTFRVFS